MTAHGADAVHMLVGSQRQLGLGNLTAGITGHGSGTCYSTGRRSRGSGGVAVITHRCTADGANAIDIGMLIGCIENNGTFNVHIADGADHMLLAGSRAGRCNRQILGSMRNLIQDVHGLVVAVGAPHALAALIGAGRSGVLHDAVLVLAGTVTGTANLADIVLKDVTVGVQLFLAFGCIAVSTLLVSSVAVCGTGCRNAGNGNSELVSQLVGNFLSQQGLSADRALLTLGQTGGSTGSGNSGNNFFRMTGSGNHFKFILGTALTLTDEALQTINGAGSFLQHSDILDVAQLGNRNVLRVTADSALVDTDTALGAGRLFAGNIFNQLIGMLAGCGNGLQTAQNSLAGRALLTGSLTVLHTGSRNFRHIHIVVLQLFQGLGLGVFTALADALVCSGTGSCTGRLYSVSDMLQIMAQSLAPYIFRCITGSTLLLLNQLLFTGSFLNGLHNFGIVVNTGSRDCLTAALGLLAGSTFLTGSLTILHTGSGNLFHIHIVVCQLLNGLLFGFITTGALNELGAGSCAGCGLGHGFLTGKVMAKGESSLGSGSLADGALQNRDAIIYTGRLFALSVSLVYVSMCTSGAALSALAVDILGVCTNDITLGAITIYIIMLAGQCAPDAIAVIPLMRTETSITGISGILNSRSGKRQHTDYHEHDQNQI